MYGAMMYALTRNNNLYMPNVVNVKAVGAVGNGTTDDSVAVQKALDFLKTSGGVIFFPVGTYFISVPLLFYSNQKLVFEKGARLLQGAAINNLMRNYSTDQIGGYNATENVEITGGIFDGGQFTENNTLLGFCHSKNVTVRDCSFVNAYGAWHDLEVNSSKNVLIDGCRFEGLRKNSSNGCLLQIDNFTSAAAWPWGDGAIDSTVSTLVEVKNCLFESCTLAPAIGNHSPSVSSYIRIHENVFDGLSCSRGAINFANASNVDVYNNTFLNCTTGMIVGTEDGSCTAHDNRFVGVTTVADQEINTYSNMVNGTYGNMI